jgi:hypothetical protein
MPPALSARYRITGGRIVWRYLLCDWKGLLDQLTAP